jgi:hypothetical protein
MSDDLTAAPERVWLVDRDEGGWHDDHRAGSTFAYFKPPVDGDEWKGVEFVRADLCAPVDAEKARSEHYLLSRGHYHVDTFGHLATRLCNCKLDAPPHRYVCAVCVDSSGVDAEGAARERAEKRALDLPPSVAQWQAAMRIVDLLDGWRELDTWWSEWDTKEEMITAVAQLIPPSAEVTRLQAEVEQLRDERQQWLNWADELTGGKEYLASAMRRKIAALLEGESNAVK